MIDCYENCKDIRNGVCPPMKTFCPKKLAEHDKQVRAENTSCIGCKHEGQWENEIEYGYPSPCVRCRRRCVDNYEIAEQSKEQKNEP